MNDITVKPPISALVCVFTFAVFSSVSQAATPLSYSMQIIAPTTGYSGAYATVLNNSGTVGGVLTSGSTGIPSEVFTWNSGVTTILPNTSDLTGGSYIVRAISDSGAVGGSANKSTVYGQTRLPVEWTASGSTLLPTKFPAGSDSVLAYASNGSMLTGSYVLNANGSVKMPLPATLTGQPAAINNQDQVVGYQDIGYYNSHTGFVYQEEQTTYIANPGGECMALPRQKCYSGTMATDINNHGQVVGGFTTPIRYSGFLPFYVNQHAYMWQAGTLRDLGTMGRSSEMTSATAINDNSFVVGSSRTVGGPTVGFVWSDAAGMLDLNSLVANRGSFQIGTAYDINNAGQILVSINDPNSSLGISTALLTPVPEPKMWVMLLTGLGIFGSVARGRHQAKA